MILPPPHMFSHDMFQKPSEGVYNKLKSEKCLKKLKSILPKKICNKKKLFLAFLEVILQPILVHKKIAYVAVKCKKILHFEM